MLAYCSNQNINAIEYLITLGININKSNNTNYIALVCSYNKNIKSDPVNYGIIIKE